MEHLLVMKGMCKDYSGVTVLKDVDLVLDEGSVLALVGENGAGKSTLIKLLSGSTPATGGEIYIDGKKKIFRNPIEAINCGISVIYQELSYYKDLTVAENIFAGRLPVTKHLKLVDWKTLNAKTAEILKTINLDIKPNTLVKKLSVAQKQLVEIAKAISRNNRIIVMDEPTATLNNTETEFLFDLILKIKASGKSIIYISHRLDELFHVADRVMILRDGRNVGELGIRDAKRDMLVKMMVGREITNIYPKKEANIGDVIFEAKGITGGIVQNASLNVRKGEIVSVFGLMGCGLTELFEEIFGVIKKDSGETTLDGSVVNIKNPHAAVRLGMAYVPPERKTTGLCMIQDIKQNIIAPSIDDYRTGFWVDEKRENKDVELMIKRLSIKCNNFCTEIKHLSGGNQQKVLLGKWIRRNPKVILINEPTRGVDVGTKAEIYEILVELCQEGYGVLMISSELPEVLALSDRIYVMCKGKINGEFSRDDSNQEKLIEYAIGW